MKLQLDAPGSFSESANGGFKYWLVTPEGKSYHGAVQCKDFFTDAMWTEHTGQPSSVCGFKWTPKTIDVSKGKFLHMAITGPGGLGKYAKQLQEFMAEIEEKMGFPRSIVTRMDNEYLVVKFSTAWTTKVYLISAFTQLIRLGPTYDGKGVVKFLKNMKTNPVCTYDNTRLPKVAERIERMMDGEVWDDPFTNYNEASRAHFGGGLTAFKIPEVANAA